MFESSQMRSTQFYTAWYGPAMPRKQRTTRIVISKVYTRSGDDGTTTLGDLTRVSKSHPQITAFANVDEANSAVGVAIAIGRLPDSVADALRAIQNDLFDVGADLSVPFDPTAGASRLRIDQSYIEHLEHRCHQLITTLTTAGWTECSSISPARATLEAASTKVRKASMSVSAAAAAEAAVNPLIEPYLDRLITVLHEIAALDNPPS